MTEPALFSLQAEQSVIGGLFLDNAALAEIGDRIAPADFYRADHRAIFATILGLDAERKPCDLVTVSEALDRRGLLADAGGLQYLATLARDCPSAANIRAYADIVRGYAQRRRLKAAAADIAALADAGDDPAGALDQAQQILAGVNDQRGMAGPVDIKAALRDLVDDIDRRFNRGTELAGLPTGFPDIDKRTGGLEPGGLYVLAAAPGAGKSTLTLNIAEHIAGHAEGNVLFWSGEMRARALVARMVATKGGIGRDRLRSGQLTDDEWPKLTLAVSLLSECRMLLDATPGATVNDLRARARRVARAGGLSLIVVDYLQRMRGTGDTRAQEVASISLGLKTLAMELGVPVIAVSSLNRDLGKRPDKRPVMSDLRESGDIEFDADGIWFIYRDEMYNPHSRDAGMAELIIAKAREGETTTVPLVWNGARSRFESACGGMPSWNKTETATDRGFEL